MAEVFLITARQAIRRGSFTSVKEFLPPAIDAFHRRAERPLPPLHLDQDRRRSTPQMAFR
jgi:hypothetical protein